MHYFIIVLILIAISYYQIKTFLSTKRKIDIFRKIFPENDDVFDLGSPEDGKTTIITYYNNSVLRGIVDSINNYLEKNKGAVSDFHLMKDIVDRNCDAVEEDINTQMPIPLYLGLVGTMSGILIGIGFLVATGSLNELLNPSAGVSGGKGITELFGGVAMAMFVSVVGIIMTTMSSYLAKEAKKEEERGKNVFLSWVQAELLPELSNDTTAVIERMAQNLVGFNQTFSENTLELRNTLQQVNDSYKGQTELMNSINKLRIGEIAKANIAVYEKLERSTHEIGVFAEYLQNSNEYLQGIREMNERLDGYENRTQIIESAGKFFAKNEKWLAENMDTANLEVKDALRRFNEGMIASLSKVQESIDGQVLIFNESVKSQQETFEKTIRRREELFQEKLEETNVIVEELKNLTSVTVSLSNLESATQQQNRKIDELTQAIKQLAEVKAETVTEVVMPQPTRLDSSNIEFRLPLWIKIVGITAGGLVSVTCLTALGILLYCIIY